MSSTPKYPPKNVQKLAEEVGEFIHYWGFRKIDGMIWAYLFMSPRALSAKELTEIIGVTKGLVSVSMKDLEHYGVIRPAGKGERRTVYYESVRDLGSVIANVLKNRERNMLANLSKSVTAAKKEAKQKSFEDKIDHNRVEELSNMIHFAKEQLDALLFHDVLFHYFDLDK
jgi:DNA-binding transcriptional regulator GbsR (MarR family)